jgi:hypothetical protein
MICPVVTVTMTRSEPLEANSQKRKSVQTEMCLRRRDYFERLHISLHIVQTAI